jgi:hypothetical protein
VHAQKVARPHPGLLPQEKGQKKSVLRPSENSGSFSARHLDEAADIILNHQTH